MKRFVTVTALISQRPPGAVGPAKSAGGEDADLAADELGDPDRGGIAHANVEEGADRHQRVGPDLADAAVAAGVNAGDKIPQ